jgi:hypothetical protein
LVDNTANFVRDYPFGLRTNAVVQGNDAPPVIAYGPANFLAARATVRRGDGALRWFTVDPTEADFRWGAVAVRLKGGIDNPANMPNVGLAQANVRAYTLPWATTAITRVVLGDLGNFFFTAVLSGCTIFIDNNPAGGPHVYHANAGNIPNPHKDTFMQGAFEDWAGRAHNAVGVRSFVSRPLISVNANSVNPKAQAREQRKQQHGRQNVQWLTIGANVMGVRTGPGAWTFYWQVVGLLEYQRNGVTVFNKHNWLEVVSSGVV